MCSLLSEVCSEDAMGAAELEADAFLWLATPLAKRSDR